MSVVLGAVAGLALALCTHAGSGLAQVPRAQVPIAQNAVPTRTGELPNSNQTRPQTSDVILVQAIERITNLPSISAKIRHQSFLFDQQLVGSGSYLQQRTHEGVKVKLELAIRTEESVTSLRHINTGRELWISENTDDQQQVSKIDLDVVREELGKDFHSHSMIDAILTGGMPALLSSLRNNFEFRKPQLLTFQRTRVWAIAGQWRPKQLKALMKDVPNLVREDGTIDPEKLPHYFPTRVFVLLGQDDLFPYRVEYRKTPTKRAKSKSRLLNRPTNDTLVTMDFYRVNLNAAIMPSAFEFESGDVHVQFATEEFIKKYR